MSLFSIAKNNIFKNLKHYSLYLFSMVFTVSVYLSFKTLKYADAVNETISGSSKLSTVFNAATIVIAIFSFVFVWYSNNFFLRKRKKEIGLYALLGIENSKIGMLLFFETLLLGLLAMVLGSVLGISFSSISFALLTKLTIDKFSFALLVSPKAIFDTIVNFLILFIIVSFQSSRVIYNHTLLELFKANNERENQPNASFIAALGSLLFIGLGYGLYFVLVKSIISIAIVTLVLVIIGTYLFFSSMLFFYIKSKKKNSSYFYKGMNIISTSQLLYRVKGNSRTFATIAILTATTLTAVGTVVGIQFNFKETVDNQYAFAYATVSENKNYLDNIEKTINKYPNNKLIDKLTVNIGHSYGDEFLTLANIDKVKNRYPSYTVISESDFKKILLNNPYDVEIASLINENDAIRFNTISSSKAQSTPSINLITKDDALIKVNIIQTENKALIDTFNTRDTLVVKDSIYEKLLLENISNFALFQIEDKHKAESLNKELTSLALNYYPDMNKEQYPTLFISYFDVYHSQSVFSGTFMFIGLFLGLIFLVCTGSIIFFKQISEAQEEIQRYKILKNIGVTDRELKNSIYKQIAFVFTAPFLVGALHSTVALTFVAQILQQKISTIMLYTILPYLLVYIFYYIMTSKYYYKIIKNQEV